MIDPKKEEKKQISGVLTSLKNCWWKINAFDYLSVFLESTKSWSYLKNQGTKGEFWLNGVMNFWSWGGKPGNKELRNLSHRGWSVDLLFVLSFTKDELYPCWGVMNKTSGYGGLEYPCRASLHTLCHCFMHWPVPKVNLRVITGTFYWIQQTRIGSFT